jgi:hypothetical protein
MRGSGSPRGSGSWLGSVLASSGNSTGSRPAGSTLAGGSDAGGSDAGGSDAGGSDAGGSDTGSVGGASTGGAGGSGSGGSTGGCATIPSQSSKLSANADTHADSTTRSRSRHVRLDVQVRAAVWLGMLARRSGVHVLVLMLVSSVAGGCKRDHDSDPPASTQPAEEPDAGGPTEGGNDLEAIGPTDTEYVGRELPASLNGELRDAEGRIIVLAPGFVAASACVDCGAPTYLWFLAVRCKAEADCEVLTESCEGSIVGSGLEFTLAFAAIEGADPKVCAAYSGSFTKQAAG